MSTYLIQYNKLGYNSQGGVQTLSCEWAQIVISKNPKHSS